MENLAGRRFSLTHPAAAATAATSPHFQLPPAVAFLFPSLLRNTAGPPGSSGFWRDAAVASVERGKHPPPPTPARPQLPGCSATRAMSKSLSSRWCACGGCSRGELFLIVQVPVGAVVKQLRGVRNSRSQREGGRAAPERKRERESDAGRSSDSWISEQRMERGHQLRARWKSSWLLSGGLL